ncbi:MAG: hypothetical protein IH945_04785 [Armatimonadetes bacterium]|nr:hypothetical protein [Armatimonadota bacterium]
MEFLRKRWPVLLLVLLPLIPLYRAVLLGEAIGPFDDVRAMMAGGVTPRAWDVLQADAVLQFYVWRDMVFESWGNFEPPYWNPYQLMGTPLLANSQSGGFYPLHILVGVLHVPTAFGVALLAWFHLAWSGLGVFRLSRALGAGEHGAVAGGALFATSPFMVSWVGLASVVTTVCWIPWALYFTFQVFRGERPLRSAALGALCLGMMLLGGHLQFAAYGFMAVVLMAAWLAVAFGSEGRLGRKIGLAVGMVAVGGCLAAPQIMPVLDYGQYRHRNPSPTRDGYAGYVATSVKGFQLSGLAFPALLGSPGKSIAGEVPWPSYWPGYIKRGANYAESSLYLGPVAILLLAGLVRRRGWRAMGSVGVVGVVGLLLAMGTPLNRLLYFYFPGWAATGSPGRSVALFMVAACVLAAFGWPEKEVSQKSLKAQGLVAFAVVGSTLLLAAWSISSVEAYDEGNAAIWQVVRGGVFAGALPSILALSALAAFVGVAWHKRRPELALGALCLGQIVLAGPGLVPTSDRPWERGEPDPNTRIAFVNEGWELKLGVPVSMPPNVAAAKRLYDIAGYDSLLHKDAVGRLNDINGQDSAPPANGNMMFIKPGADRTKLADSGVTEIWTLSDYGFDARGKLVKERIEGPGRANVGEIPAVIVADTYRTQTVRASGPGTLVVRDMNMPGWSASVDGAPAEIGGTLWRHVELGSGEHEIRFKYTPPGLFKGLVLFLAGALLCAFGLLRGGGARGRS